MHIQNQNDIAKSQLIDVGQKSSASQATLKESAGQPERKNFLDHLLEAMEDINKEQKSADQLSTDVASGKKENIHETMLALSQAELNFKYMIQVRNKVLEAYQEVMRIPV